MAISATLIPETKVCTRCSTPKPLDYFHKSRQHKTGLHPWCRDCRRVSTRERWLRDPELMRKLHRERQVKHRYGITQDEYLRLFEKQQGRCAICGGTEPRCNGARLCVDHDHATGKVRGLLCTPCNLAAGYLADSAERAELLAAYLRS